MNIAYLFFIAILIAVLNASLALSQNTAKRYNKTEAGFGPGSVRRFNVSSSVYTYLAGIQVKDNTKTKKLSSFFHALAGGGTLTQKFTGDCLSEAADPCAAFNYSLTGFAAAIGGGIDVRAGKRLSIRLIQADYNPTFTRNGTLNNFRIGAGIVFH